MLNLLLLSVAAATPNQIRRALALPPFETQPGERLDVALEMRDGTPLKTVVRLPEGEGPWPVVFIRNPYPIERIVDRECGLYVRYGFACVWQMVRGRGASQGEWQPFVHEGQDGLDALDWIIDQPWSDGNIGMTGASYLGGVQWAVADRLPEEVKTLIPMVIGTDMYHNTYEGGMFRHELVGAFLTLIPDDGFYPMAGRRYQQALHHRPRREMDRIVAGEPIPWAAPWMDAQLRSDAYWQAQQVLDFAGAAGHLDIPVLMIGGWSDAFLATQLDTWKQLSTKNGSTLVIGPWDHLGRSAGDIDFDNVNDSVGLQDSYFQLTRILDWLNHHLKGHPAQHPVGQTLTYVVNDNRWAVRSAWPPETTPQTWSLSDGDASQCSAPLGGSLPPSGVAARFTYDPADPTPSVGGAGSLAAVLSTYKGIEAGFADQKDLCTDRLDMLGWLSPPLESSLHIAGSISAILQVSSSAPDTAFNIRILDVRPDGRVIHVREGIRALSLRDGDSKRVPYTPGASVTLPLETWPIEYVFQEGSRVLFQVASSSFPKFEAHSNTTVYWADAVETQPAEQAVYLEGSQITLPVVPQPVSRSAAWPAP